MPKIMRTEPSTSEAALAATSTRVVCSRDEKLDHDRSLVAPASDDDIDVFSASGPIEINLRPSHKSRSRGGRRQRLDFIIQIQRFSLVLRGQTQLHRETPN